jgi:3-hydroxyacyl-[acyl-carrier-protein] dehydratase
MLHLFLESGINMKLNSNQIQQILPHRYPFLMVDTIEDIIDETSIVGKKNVTVNEATFMGHFPDKHVMPGVLLVEALADTGAVLLLLKEEYKGKYVYLAGINRMRFKKMVVPGDSVYLYCTLKTMRSNMGIVSVHAKVEGEIVCEGEILFAVDNSTQE